MLQFVNKDIIPLDGPTTIKAAYKLWKQTGSKQKQQPASEKWQRLSKAETAPPKTSDTLKVHAQAASEDQAWHIFPVGIIPQLSIESRHQDRLDIA